jgi:TrpR family transcriptional regulator, trp operon repressor
MAQDDLEKFLGLCLHSGSVALLKELFDLFFTFEEKEHLASRYKIIQALEKSDLTQREIAEKFNVSIAQITRGSNALKVITPQLKNFLKQELE